MLSYFGTDQSQVQRYLAAKSVDEARTSLLMSAYWKIPLQALVLLVGVLVFVYYQYHRGPILFNPAHERAVRAAFPQFLADLQARYDTASSPLAARRAARPGARATRAESRTTSAQRRELHHPALRRRPSAARTGRALHRRRDRRGDERDLRRAHFAVERDGDRLLSTMDQARGERRALSWSCRARRSRSGACSRASWRTTPSTSARSSKS